MNSLGIKLPWRRVLDSDEAASLLAELLREISPKHPLAGLKLTVCARRIDRDDILVSIDNFDKPLATVHLTWRKEKETDPRWPRTRFFSSWEEWQLIEMLPAHEEQKPMTKT